jgi:predicted DNA-binding transcriptional regulator AlpA
MGAAVTNDQTSPRREKRPPRGDVLPLSTPQLGLNEHQAAAYIGCGVTHFREMVKDGSMPKPRNLGVKRFVWDRRELELAFANLPKHGDEETNPWDVGPN